MAEITVTVNDADGVTNKTVDEQGRIYLGKQFANTRLKIAFAVLEDSGSNQTTNEPDSGSNEPNDTNSDWMNTVEE